MTVSDKTNKQQEILHLIPRFRFLNRIQIQHFLHHKYHNRINEWLKNLKNEHYLEWIYSTEFEKKSQAAIYYLGLNGVRFLKTQGNYPPSLIRKLYRDKDRSDNFINQCLLVADCFLTFRDHPVDGVRYDVTTASDLERANSSYHFLMELNIHLVIKKTEIINGQATQKYFLLEAFEPTLPGYSIRKKLRNYLDFYFGGTWESNVNAVFPTLLFICPSKPILIYAKRYAKKLLDENDRLKNLRICFATVDDIKKHGANAHIWEEAGVRYR